LKIVDAQIFTSYKMAVHEVEANQVFAFLRDWVSRYHAVPMEGQVFIRWNQLTIVFCSIERSLVCLEDGGKLLSPEFEIREHILFVNYDFGRLRILGDLSFEEYQACKEMGCIHEEDLTYGEHMLCYRNLSELEKPYIKAMRELTPYFVPITEKHPIETEICFADDGVDCMDSLRTEVLGLAQQHEEITVEALVALGLFLQWAIHHLKPSR